MFGPGFGAPMWIWVVVLLIELIVPGIVLLIVFSSIRRRKMRNRQNDEIREKPQKVQKPQNVQKAQKKEQAKNDDLWI